MSFQIGDTVGDYQIIGLLGAGGMGRVYKVKNTISDRVDALKVLLPNLADDQELADRFIREIKVLASLNHPNIAGLRTAIRQENQLLMVMEFVEGTTLEDRIKTRPVTVPEAIGYIKQVLAALGYAHKHGVVHRDIKPANMMLTPDNVIKLMDFGIAKSKTERKLTQTGTTMGSLYYMSGEQVQGEELDGRSDLYSVGVSLYELITGSRPFQGKSDFDIMIAQLQQAPRPPIELRPDLPKALNEIIIISLEKDRAKRFQTAEAFSAALDSLTAEQLSATPGRASTGTAVGFATPGQAYAAPSATDLMPTVTAPAPAESTPPLAVGGPVPPPAGGLPTSDFPTVSAPPPEAPAVAPPPPDPSHGVPAPSGPKGYRGLYMTLGALIVLAVLVLAAIQLPRYLKTKAGGDQTAQLNSATTPSTPIPTTNTGGSQPPSGTDSSASSAAGGSQTAGGSGGTGSGGSSPMAGFSSGSNSGSASGGTPSDSGGSVGPQTSGGGTGGASGLPSGGTTTNKGGHSAHTGGKSSTNQATGSGTETGGGQVTSPPASGGGGQVEQPPADNKAAELEQLEDLHTKLSVRAQTENDNVENLRHQMGAQGNNLRSDIAAAQTRMKIYMDKFDKAMNEGDPVAAKKYMAQAEHEVETLEKFFGH